MKLQACRIIVPKRDRAAYKEEFEQTMTELKTISMRNDFPKYARLKRKLTKLTSDNQQEGRYETILGLHRLNRIKAQLSIGCITFILHRHVITSRIIE